MNSPSSKLRQPLIIFYVVVIYSFASFAWWCYLLLEKNYQIYQEKKIVLQLRHRLHDEEGDYQNTEKYEAIKSEYSSQNYMIIGEGLVFFLILIAGMYKIRSTFFREIELANQQNNLLLSITHELKSPLSSIRLALQTLSRKGLSEQNKDKVISNSLEDTQRLEDLVNNILLAAKIEGNTYGGNFEKLNLSLLLQSVMEKEKQAEEDQQFYLSIEEGIFVRGDQIALASVITNILENALKYNPKDQPIDVKLQKQGDEAVLHVADRGKGIPDDEKKRVFEKFYRLGKEETRSTQGVGLGLFIVKSIVEYHGGSVSVSDHEPMGAIFELRLPAHPPDS